MHNKANLYREIFLKSKKQIDKKLVFLNNKEKRHFLEKSQKDEILKSENEIKAAFDKAKCNNCGTCCNLAISEFPPEALKNKVQNGDISSKSFLETFELYENNTAPNNLLQNNLCAGFIQNSSEKLYFYHCKKVQMKDGKSFCPVYEKRPMVCRNFPDTPLEILPKTCAYNKWKEENETKALFIKALNDIRKFYIENLPE